MHGHLNGDTTAELLVRQDRLDDARRLRCLLRERANARPDGRYTRTTIAVGIVAVLDWLAIIVHTMLEHGALSAWLGTHQVLVVTLSISSVCLGIGWAISSATCRREAERDEMEQIRHRELMHEVRELFRAMAREGDVETQAALAGTQELLNRSGTRRGVAAFPPRRGGVHS